MQSNGSLERIAESTIAPLVKTMVLALVDDAGWVQVTPRLLEDRCVVEILVSPNDLGKVIGKQGRMARALRCVCDAAARKAGFGCQLNILRSEEQEGAG